MKLFSRAKKTKIFSGYFAILLFSIIYFIPQGVQGKPKPDDIARDIIKSYFGYEKVKFNEGKVVWFDLLSKGSNTEFYAIYDNGRTTILDVFTIRYGHPENLYHEVYCGYEMGAYHAAISNKMFFISSNRGGSGGYLSLSMFDYGGVGKLSLVNQIEDIFQGNILVVDNSVYIGGNTQIYELKYNGKIFTLEKYQKRISCNQNGSHVLAYHIKDGKFFIAYDGKEVIFQKTDKTDVQHSIEPIVIGLNELIVIDDNLEEPQEVRLLMHKIDKLSLRGGLFSSLIPKAVGTTTMSISYNYKMWYEIEVVIKKDAL